MSGPKYVDVNGTLNRDERAELNTILASLPGVSLGYSMVRIEEYSRVTVAEVRRCVAEAKQRVRAELERRRREELAAAKKRESLRVQQLVGSVRARAQKHEQDLKAVLFRCDALIKKAGGATSFAFVENITLGDRTGGLKKEIERLKAEQTKAASLRDQRTAELEKYSRTLDGFSSIEALEKAIARSPSDVLDFSFAEQNAERTAAELEQMLANFSALQRYLEKVDKILESSPEMRPLAVKINQVVRMCDVADAQSVESCINGIATIESKYLAEKRKEKMSESFAKAVTVLEDARREALELRPKSITVKDGGVDAACRESMARADELIKQLEALEFFANENQSTLRAHKSRMGAPAVLSAATAKSLAHSVTELSALLARATEDDKNFREYQQHYKAFRRVVDDFGTESLILSPREYPFVPANAKNSINLMRAEAERVTNQAKLFRRNASAEQIKISLNSGAKQFVLFEERVGDTLENTRLLFAERGAFGVLIEYLVEPGGNFIRKPLGVQKPEGEALTDDKSLLAYMEGSCEDMQRIRQDFGQMGYENGEIQITEQQSPQEYLTTAPFLRLKDKVEAERYIRAVAEDGRYEFYMDVYNEIADGRTLAEAWETAAAKERARDGTESRAAAPSFLAIDDKKKP